MDKPPFTVQGFMQQALIPVLLTAATGTTAIFYDLSSEVRNMNTTLVSLTVQLEHTRLAISDLKDTTKVIHTMIRSHDEKIIRLESMVDREYGGGK